MAVSFTVCITQRIPDRPPKFPSFDEDQADLLWDMMVSSWAHVSSDRPDSNAMRNWLTGIKPPRLYGGPESIPVYALIIAVNGAGLGAPELDAAKLRSTLASLGITSIDMLVGRAATRQNIIQSLNSVADNPRIPHDAPIIIYYAGHGTQQSINIPGAGPRKVECIVPVDSLSGKPPAPPIPVITISALVSRIAQKKSKHIVRPSKASDLLAAFLISQQTFIFDCGHSGGFSFPDITSYSLLASCHETQVSQEYGAPPQGLFTTSLLEALAECVEDKILWTVTHAALFERIKAIMQDTQRGNQRALPYPQVPQYVGGIKDRPVFSTSVLPPSSQAITPLVGDPNHGTCLLPLGSLAGVHPQTFFAIYDYPNGWLKLMGKFKVVNLSDSQTMLSIGRIQILPEAYAVMYTPPVALPVEMVGDFPALYNNRSFQNDLISRLGSHEPLDHFVAPVGSGHRSKVRASYSKGQGSVELRNTYGGALHIRNPLRASDALSKAVMFFHHLDQPNLSPLHNSSMFDIRIHELAPAKASDWSAIDHIEVLVPRRDRAPIAMQPTPGGCTVPGSDSSFGLQIINRGAYPFFVHVFYFDPNDYSIASIYLPPGPNVALLPARGELTIGYGDAGASPLSFTIGHHIERDSGFIKVYYSTSPSDMGFIQQDGCEGRRGSHPGDAAHVTSPLSLTVDDNVQKDSGFVKAFSSSYISFIQQDGFDERGDSSPRGAAGEDTSAHGDGRQDAFYGQQTQTQHTRPGTPDTRRDPHYTAHQPSPYPFGSITYPITVTNPRRL
ncbi:hypothetical protein FRC12_000918 [Ceratobasidium sp. 428]|nr:hypothetical protein FRC12_000918 [Ceratobasidium sp. 428]